jgi:hypothetical protein
MRSSVVLPQPEPPSRQKISPLKIVLDPHVFAGPVDVAGGIPLGGLLGHA